MLSFNGNITLKISMRILFILDKKLMSTVGCGRLNSVQLIEPFHQQDCFSLLFASFLI